MTYNGRNSLVGGEGEDEFACRVCRAIWRANGAFCEVDASELTRIIALMLQRETRLCTDEKGRFVDGR